MKAKLDTIFKFVFGSNLDNMGGSSVRDLRFSASDDAIAFSLMIKHEKLRNILNTTSKGLVYKKCQSD
ncbi:hypothetical protein HanIR_Chr02g0063651 [Helianthus annuus]|nr:hypothetical protein HanIR_Chr02g0063651 [Helianthus annuus]